MSPDLSPAHRSDSLTRTLCLLMQEDKDDSDSRSDVTPDFNLSPHQEKVLLNFLQQLWHLQRRQRERDVCIISNECEGADRELTERSLTYIQLHVSSVSEQLHSVHDLRSAHVKVKCFLQVQMLSRGHKKTLYMFTRKCLCRKPQRQHDC